ncbi:MAG: NAD+ synthase [Candidatus Cloacimonetes bacterium]|nr:NAD+ synthase [Candidatus Cloacimonadota bacterium]
MRQLNIQLEMERIPEFIRRQVAGAGMRNVIIGLSGGIDSSLVAALCVHALGKQNVLGIMLPYRDSHPDSLDDATAVAAHLGISTRTIDISPMVDAYFDACEQGASALRRGNRMARERMCVLYDLSAKHNALVAGTGNKSELSVGYFTQHGDGACAFEPIGHLYKTEVFALARHIGLPQRVICKPPTADLWHGQTDEAEMGITYDMLDHILYHIFELGEDNPAGISAADIDKVRGMALRSAFKRSLPPTLPDV